MLRQSPRIADPSVQQYRTAGLLGVVVGIPQFREERCFLHLAVAEDVCESFFEQALSSWQTREGRIHTTSDHVFESTIKNVTKFIQTLLGEKENVTKTMFQTNIKSHHVHHYHKSSFLRHKSPLN